MTKAWDSGSADEADWLLSVINPHQRLHVDLEITSYSRLDRYT